MKGWQDISTAPKDGTRIDLWAEEEEGGRRIADAYWMSDANFRPAGYDRDDYRGWWAPNYGWDGDDGPCEEPERTLNDGRRIFVRATHWMSIPEGPK